MVVQLSRSIEAAATRGSTEPRALSEAAEGCGTGGGSRCGPNVRAADGWRFLLQVGPGSRLRMHGRKARAEVCHGEGHGRGRGWLPNALAQLGLRTTGGSRSGEAGRWRATIEEGVNLGRDGATTLGAAPPRGMQQGWRRVKLRSCHRGELRGSQRSPEALRSRPGQRNRV